MDKSTQYNVFFAKQADDRSKFRIYLNGSITPYFVTKRDMPSILDHNQFVSFTQGESIFYVDKEVIKPYLKDTPPENPAKRWEAK
jgi:hypothetical protein